MLTVRVLWGMPSFPLPHGVATLLSLTSVSPEQARRHPPSAPVSQPVVRGHQLGCCAEVQGEGSSRSHLGPRPLQHIPVRLFKDNGAEGCREGRQMPVQMDASSRLAAGPLLECVCAGRRVPAKGSQWEGLDLWHRGCVEGRGIIASSPAQQSRKPYYQLLLSLLVINSG